MKRGLLVHQLGMDIHDTKRNGGMSPSDDLALDHFEWQERILVATLID